MFLDDIDFTKLKLPIEPQNMIYIYLAYKLINNLDKIQIGTAPAPIPRMPPMMNRPMPLNSLHSIILFFILLTFGFMILSNILSSISVSTVSMEPIKLKIPNKCPKNMNGCHIKKSVESFMNKCPMKPDPMDKEKYNEMLQKCPFFKSDKKEDQETEK